MDKRKFWLRTFWIEIGICVLVAAILIVHEIFPSSTSNPAIVAIAPTSDTTQNINSQKDTPSSDSSSDNSTSVLGDTSDTTQTTLPQDQSQLAQYIEVTDSCGPHFQGDCLNVHSKPSMSAPVVSRLRTGVVLKTSGEVENDGHTWYKIIFDEGLRYPERLTSSWYVDADYVQVIYNEGPKELTSDIISTTTKRIIVDRSEQMLYAYDGDSLFLQTPVSTGILLTPTPRGTFTIFRKTPSRYMQGPIPGISTEYYDLPGVPWDLYFTEQGAAIHGAYWHNDFGKTHSNGCVNLPLDQAKKLYDWADLGIPVTVQD